MSAVEYRLWLWVRPESLDRTLTPIAVASLLEIICEWSVDQRLQDLVFDRLCDETQGRAIAYDKLKTPSPASTHLSRLFESVLEPLDR